MTKEKQEELIEFIRAVASKVEKENFGVKRLNASNIPYKLYGNPISKGNLFIIGNNSLLRRVKYRYKRNNLAFLKKNFKFKLNKFQKLIDKDAKGIIIVFNDDYESNQYEIKRIVGINKSNYAYLDIINDIYNNHKDSNLKENREPYLYSLDYLNTSKRKTNKRLIKTLNN